MAIPIFPDADRHVINNSLKIDYMLIRIIIDSKVTAIIDNPPYSIMSKLEPFADNSELFPQLMLTILNSEPV